MATVIKTSHMLCAVDKVSHDSKYSGIKPTNTAKVNIDKKETTKSVLLEKKVTLLDTVRTNNIRLNMPSPIAKSSRPVSFIF